ncbi:MAG TPA: LysR substrate-binding domain-containing protein [Chthonomonadaceae bacterium]|nr:LysR substrate-binding domain-containing protein [Chthonomonadaceae bacterium]
MELFQLRYFVAAARLRHFTRAAEEMCVSQPSLSLQIANLEREVGARLFLRHGRSVSLTDAGEALLRHAERILAAEEEARRAVQEVLGLRRGRLTLWTLPTPGQHLLPPLLAAFRRAYPQIEIFLRETVPARAVAEAVAEGRADIGIVHLPYQVTGLAERVLLREEMALVVPETHPLASGGPVPLSAVAQEDFIWAPEGATEAHPLYAACLAAGFAPHIACVSGSAQGMQTLVAAGLGITLLPRLAIHPPPGARVVELLPPRPTRTLVAVWRADCLSHAASAFLALLESREE